MDALMVLLGILAGTFTGLVPGVHVNLLAALIVALGVGAQGAAFLVALSITHSFLSVIPGVLLGAPEADTALGVLPGHRYLLKGLGYMAVKLTLVGSLFGLLIALALVPAWYFMIGFYDYVRPYIGYALLAVSAYMIARDRHKAWSLAVYGLAGVMGLLILRRTLVEEPLFPMLSGLFGVSTLLYGLKTTSAIPTQRIEKRIALRRSDTVKALLAGNAAGFIASWLPGLGSAQAAVLGMKLAPRVGDHGFLIMLGAISTVNFSLSLLTWLLLDKARNGAVVALSTITMPTVETVSRLAAVALIAAGAATLLGIYLTRLAVKTISKIPYKATCLGVIGLIAALVLWISGARGFFVLAVATAIGLVPAIVKCSRAHAMGCLMLPVAVWLL
jgi:putative membrane protein